MRGATRPPRTGRRPPAGASGSPHLSLLGIGCSQSGGAGIRTLKGLRPPVFETDRGPFQLSPSQSTCAVTGFMSGSCRQAVFNVGKTRQSRRMQNLQVDRQPVAQVSGDVIPPSCFLVSPFQRRPDRRRIGYLTAVDATQADRHLRTPKLVARAFVSESTASRWGAATALHNPAGHFLTSPESPTANVRSTHWAAMTGYRPHTKTPGATCPPSCHPVHVQR